MAYTIQAGNTSETVEGPDMMATCERLGALGPLTIHDGSRYILVNGSAPSTCAALAPVETVKSPMTGIMVTPIDANPSKPVSTWTHQVTDDTAKARIEAQHATLAAHGIAVNTAAQLYATGTRMATEGYASQASRKADHDKSMPAREACDALSAAVHAEGREDRMVTARDLAKVLDDKLTVYGHRLTEYAIRGMLARSESPALGYVLGLRDRIAANPGDAGRALRAADRAKIADTLRYELDRAGDVELKLRTRRDPGDVFAVVSPAYTPADAPQVLREISHDLPRDAKGSWSYDPESTAWELRADVWTPTPVAEQSVGEAFSGYVSFRSKDNGSSRFRGGGGVLLLRCLNASTYTASSSDVERVHRGRIMYDIGSMLRGATKAIAALCEAWGTNRAEVIEAPPVPLSVAIPGFWSYLLKDRSSELAGVLPGRSAEHVSGLTKAFHAERRDSSRLVRSDFAQGWTRYIQGQPTPVRREAESAIGEWLVSGGKMGCDLPKA
jgi:hypothetical protein